MEVCRMTKVLVVDDNRDLLDAVAFALTYHQPPFEVATASNGEEGLELLMSFQPDVAVIDVVMPQLNGYQLVRAIRGDPATAQIPLVILSALAQTPDILTGQYAGVDIYLTKPLNPQQLVSAIEQALQLSSTDRDRRIQALSDQAESEA